MKGRKCKCGFATLAKKTRCPKCGRVTRETEWDNSGKVLSSTRLDVVPETLEGPMDLTLVIVDGAGPKVNCWCKDHLFAGDDVVVDTLDTGIHVCRKKA